MHFISCCENKIIHLRYWEHFVHRVGYQLILAVIIIIFIIMSMEAYDELSSPGANTSTHTQKAN